MNYQEFRKTYAWTLKRYQGTHELFFDDFYGKIIGKCKITKYENVNGKWRKISENVEDVTPAFYFNTIDSVPFFRNWGGIERVSCGHCVRGYVPMKISSTDPWNSAKTVREFKLF